jgi:hypothetical protein
MVILEENSVKFQRFECKVGFIDIKTESKSEFEIHKMYRLNGVGNWRIDDLPSQGLDRLVEIMMDNCSSNDIWNIVFPN